MSELHSSWLSRGRFGHLGSVPQRLSSIWASPKCGSRAMKAVVIPRLCRERLLGRNMFGVSTFPLTNLDQWVALEGVLKVIG